MTESRQTESYTNSARDLRKARARRLAVRFGAIVMIPTLMATLYYTAIASDIYQSEAIITVQSSESRPQLGVAAILGAVTGGATAQDAMTVQEYILSREMLAQIDTSEGFSGHYSNPNADFWSRLASDATFEDKFEYYQKRVRANYDTQSGILKVTVQAYTAEKSKAINDAILQRSEEKVNTLSERAKRDQIAFAKKEVTVAEERLTSARYAILELQKQGAEFHPLKEAGTVLTIQGELESELVKARAELAQLLATMASDAPKAVALRQRIQALQMQLRRENKRLVDPENEALNTSIARFETAMIEKEFAAKQYEAAMATLELAKLEADKKSRYLATIAAPSLPDEALYPKRALGVLTIFLVCFAIFGIGSLLIAAIKEHARL
ncbi:MAG: Wzz/FepE/Etk N-terminal domain-containing protein [Myxococcota bacterium]|nr:Wzz/FepE/Etk N-terminal domain-containing protein [Myxococcota bacterium]